MDNKFKFSQLAKCLTMHQASINMAVKRGHLICDDNKLINIKLAHNKVWIEKQEAKGKKFDLNLAFKPVQPRVKKEPPSQEIKLEPASNKKEITVSDLRGIELKQKKATLQRTLRGIKLDELRIEKQEGKLIPYDAVKKVFLFAVETFRVTYLQEVKGLANIFINRLGGEHRHFIELQKELSEKIELIQLETIDNLITGIDGVVSEFKEVRERGEKK